MRPHDHHLRAEAVRLCVEDGLSQAAISRKLGVSYDSVRTWVKRYKAHGAKGLLPAYSNCGRSPVFNSRIIERALEYKTRHPEWGTGFIRLKLEDDFPGQPLPKSRRLQQVFKAKGVQPERTRLPKTKGSWAARPFDRVQVDAKERLKTADGQVCCYLNFVDEHTGSELDAFVFPLCPHQ